MTLVYYLLDDDTTQSAFTVVSFFGTPINTLINPVADASISQQLLNGNPLLALPALFLGGVLTSLTPCVYPMIPITAAIVGGQSAGETTSRLRPVLLTLTYVIGLAMVYSALGVFAGITGTLFGSADEGETWTTIAQHLPPILSVETRVLDT